VLNKLAFNALLILSLVVMTSSAGAASKPAEAGHPDLSGVWTMYVEAGAPPQDFLAFGPRSNLPLTALGKQRVDAYRALVGPTSDNPGAHCLGSGMPESMTFSGVYPMENIQRPEQITLIYEAHTELRRLYFGHKIIPEADRVPARNGYSTARWEGKSLVVETTSLKDQDDQMYPHTDGARILEKYHLETNRAGTRVLVNEWVLTDPAFYTQPVSGVKKWAFEPKGLMLPYECDEEVWLDHLNELKKKAQPAAPAAK
jgi:hypothetical protein